MLCFTARRTVALQAGYHSDHSCAAGSTTEPPGPSPPPPPPMALRGEEWWAAWLASRRQQAAAPAAAGDEVLIVGGGIMGASVAYFLAQLGVRSTLLEAEAVACGASALQRIAVVTDGLDGPTDIEFDPNREVCINTLLDPLIPRRILL